MRMARKQWKPFPPMPAQCFAGLRWEKRQYGWVPVPIIYQEQQYLNKRDYYRARFALYSQLGRPIYKLILKEYMPCTRIRRQWATYIKLAIQGNSDNMLNRSDMVLWGGTLPTLDFVKSPWSFIKQGYEITWQNTLEFSTIVNYQVVCFLHHWSDGSIKPMVGHAQPYEQSLTIQCNDVDGVPGYIIWGFVAQVGAHGISAISPCRIIWGTGWYWHVTPP